MHLNRKNANSPLLIQQIQKKSPIHENMNAKITCDVGDDRCRIAAARLEKDIFVNTHLHTSPIVVKIMAKTSRPNSPIKNRTLTVKSTSPDKE